MSTEPLNKDPLKKKDGTQKVKANGEPLNNSDLLMFVKNEIARKFRLAALTPEPGDLVNEDNYDLRNVAYYIKKYKKFDKTKRNSCKYEYDKIKSD